jgi:hypothetical protein
MLFLLVSHNAYDQGMSRGINHYVSTTNRPTNDNILYNVYNDNDSSDNGYAGSKSRHGKKYIFNARIISFHPRNHNA